MNYQSSWGIYFDSIEHPGLYVVREFFIQNGSVVPSPACRVAPDLETARGFVPEYMVRFDRQEGDDPSLVESYL